VSFGSGIIDDRVVACDYACGACYELCEREEYDYVLTGADGSLQVTKPAYRGPAVSTGTLALVRGGRLEIARERQISP